VTSGARRSGYQRRNALAEDLARFSGRKKGLQFLTAELREGLLAKQNRTPFSDAIEVRYLVNSSRERRHWRSEADASRCD